MTGPGLAPGARARVAFVWEGRAGVREERGELVMRGIKCLEQSEL